MINVNFGNKLSARLSSCDADAVKTIEGVILMIVFGHQLHVVKNIYGLLGEDALMTT
jgi:hypothetical protein